MRLCIVGCLVVALLFSGCAEQRHAIARLSPWKTMDAPLEKLPPWVKYEDPPESHPWLTAAGLVAVGILLVAGILAYSYLDYRSSQEPHSL